MLKAVFSAVFALLLTLGVVGRSVAHEASTGGRPDVLFITLKGFRWDFLDRGITPTLSQIAGEGVRARGLKPSFPPYSRPGYFTLMTGLRPDRHGIIDNTMLDPNLPGKTFGPSNREASDPIWWTDAEPLWATAERAGIKTASSNYPAANVPNGGVLPSYSGPDQRNAPVSAQIDLVVKWLTKPAVERPRLVLLDLQQVDLVGHAAGPDSPEENEAIQQIDRDLAQLRDRLVKAGVWDKLNVVIVSDQGMAGISLERTVFLDTLVDVTAFETPTFGSLTGVNPVAGREVEVERGLVGRHDHFQCWRKRDFPKRLHYGTHRRVPSILCLADVGWQVGPAAKFTAYYRGMKGNHGFDPDAPEMWGIFLATGPSFALGRRVQMVDNVDIYPLLATLIGVSPRPNDGRTAALRVAMR